MSLIEGQSDLQTCVECIKAGYPHRDSVQVCKLGESACIQDLEYQPHKKSQTP